MEANRDAYTAKVKVCADPTTGLPRSWCMAENSVTATICSRCGSILIIFGFGRGPFGHTKFGSKKK